MLRWRGFLAGLSRLTSRFDMHEDGVDYAEMADLWLDEQLWPLRWNVDTRLHGQPMVVHLIRALH